MNAHIQMPFIFFDYWCCCCCCCLYDGDIVIHYFIIILFSSRQIVWKRALGAARLTEVVQLSNKWFLWSYAINNNNNSLLPRINTLKKQTDQTKKRVEKWANRIPDDRSFTIFSKYLRERREKNFKLWTTFWRCIFYIYL